MEQGDIPPNEIQYTPPLRYVIAECLIGDPKADEDGKVKGVEAGVKWKRTSIDLWLVTEITEGWVEGTLDLHYEGEEEPRHIKGEFDVWFELHVTAKMDETQMVRFPSLN